MTTAVFNHINLAGVPAGHKLWTKVDVDYSSFSRLGHKRPVTNLRDVHPATTATGGSGAGEEGAAAQEDDGTAHVFNTDTSGFAVYHEPSSEKSFTSDAAVRGPYYAEIEAILRNRLTTGQAKVKKVVIFDHTIRRRDPNSARAPVQSVHVDQTPGAAEVRVRRHVTDPKEAEDLIANHRFQIVNVWRPIGNPASDHPLAVIDWRSTSPGDFVPIDLLYPKRSSPSAPAAAAKADSPMEGQHNDDDDDDDRGKEVRPEEHSIKSTEGYEVKGETMAVQPNPKHRYYYQKDMTPEEVILLKCYDSAGEGMSLEDKWWSTRQQGQKKERIAVRTPHTAFEDPNTPADAPPRQSIEVRCLVFYE